MGIFDFLSPPDPAAVEIVQNYPARWRVHQMLYTDLTGLITAAGPTPPQAIQAALNELDAAVARERNAFEQLRTIIRSAVTKAYREKTISREDAAKFAQVDAGPEQGLGLLPLVIIAVGVAAAVVVAAGGLAIAALKAADGAVAKEQAEAQAITLSVRSQVAAWKAQQSQTTAPISFPPLVIPRTNDGPVTAAAKAAGTAGTLGLLFVLALTAAALGRRPRR